MKPEKEFDRDTVREMLVKKLREAKGKSYSARQLGNMFGVGTPAMQTMCLELRDEGTLRAGRTECDAEGWYLPTDAQKNLERAMKEKAESFRQLKKRTAHAEAVERARADRLAIKSIY